MLSLAVFVSILGLCAAVPDSTAPATDPPYRSNGYEGWRPGYDLTSIGYGSYRNLETQLERLDVYLDNLETREANQIFRLDRLEKSANLNVDFANNFQSTIGEQIEFHQAQQDKRCDALDEAIARIRLIRERVLNLTVDAEAIRTNLEVEVFPINKQIASDIRHLQHEDILRQNRITETEVRADAINTGIDVLIEKAWSNTRTIYVLFRDIKTGIKSVNRERTTASVGVLDPSGVNFNDSAAVDFDPPFDGAPQYAVVLLTGFHLVRDNYFHAYDVYPSIYFGIDNFMTFSRAEVTSTDMSTGGWTAEALYFLAGCIYYDSNTLALQLKTEDLE